MDNWPDLESQWSQWDLHRWVRQMGINPDPDEILPQGVKLIMWPQPPVTQEDIEVGQKLAAEIEAGTHKPLCSFPRKRDPRRN